MTGQTVLAALVAAGEMVCRTTAGGAARGMFCGMGVCQDCIVDIDGVANRRACMTPARAGMAVAAATPRPEPTAAADPEMAALTPDVLAPDVLVIGGGPAGLAAAAVAAEAGLDVVLIDERSKLGGQFYKQPADGFRIDERAIDKQFRNGRALIARVAASGARCIPGMTAWAAFGADEVWASSPTSSLGIRPRRVVLATGAYERGVPLPGWTLPGCMTTGAAQTLLRSYQIAPGSRVLLGGNGPLNLQVAAELAGAGVTVVALVDAAARLGPRMLASLASMAIAAPDLVRDGLAYRNTLRRARVPIFHRHAIVRVEGHDAGQAGLHRRNRRPRQSGPRRREILRCRRCLLRLRLPAVERNRAGDGMPPSRSIQAWPSGGGVRSARPQLGRAGVDRRRFRRTGGRASGPGGRHHCRRGRCPGPRAQG